MRGPSVEEEEGKAEVYAMEPGCAHSTLKEKTERASEGIRERAQKQKKKKTTTKTTTKREVHTRERKKREKESKREREKERATGEPVPAR